MSRRVAVAVILTACAVLAAGRPAAVGTARAAGPRDTPNPAWTQWDAKTKTATLTIVAAYNTTVGGGFNFNGYNMGHLTITVPKGAKVVIDFTNKASLPHSAVITPAASHTLAGNFPLAFKGSASPSAMNGVANQTKPQTFSFVASKEGAYALVCGVPGHALAGMWDVFTVANVDKPSMSVTGTAAGAGSGGSGQMPMPACHDSKMGAVGGTVEDATSGKPLAHAFVVVGWTTLKVVGETAADGTYCITGLPEKFVDDKGVSHTYVDAFGFHVGYVYYHGHPIVLHAGKTVSYSFKMPRQTFADDQLPHLSGATISPAHIKPGDTATFSVHIKPGKGGPLSAEVFAVNGQLGQSVLLTHAGSDVYSGTWKAPAGTKAGTYTFSFFAAMANCLENPIYPLVKLTVVKG